MWACRHTLDGSVGGRLHDTTGVLAESGSEKQGRKDMSKANKGAWQNSATGIASHRIASHRIASHRIASHCIAHRRVFVSGRCVLDFFCSGIATMHEKARKSTKPCFLVCIARKGVHSIASLACTQNILTCVKEKPGLGLCIVWL